MIYFLAVFPVLIYSLSIFWLVRSASDKAFLRLLFCVFMGMLSAGMALVLEYLWNLFMGDFIASHRSLIIVESFIGVSAIEETAKWVWLVFIIYHWGSYGRYSDGILYACGIAAGFNLVEGLLYVWTDDNIMNVVVRGITAVPVHFLFAIIMGFLFARFKLERRVFFGYQSLALSFYMVFMIFSFYSSMLTLLVGGAILVFAGCLSLSIWVCRYALHADRLSWVDS